MPNNDDKNQPGTDEGKGREDESPGGESSKRESIEGETIEETIQRHAARRVRSPLPDRRSARTSSRA